MKRTIPTFKSDEEAEEFVETADLSEYDLNGTVVRFELKRKDKTVSLRLPESLLKAVRVKAPKAGMPYQRFIRLAVERALETGETEPPQSNRLDTLSSLAMRAIASPISGAMVMTRMLLGDADRLGRRDGVGQHQFGQVGGGDARDRAARQHAVGDIGRDALGAGREQRVGGVAQRAAGIDDVVEQHAIAALHVADDVHHLRFAGALAALVDDGERRVEALGERAGAHDAADVGRHHHHVARRRRAP